MAADIDVTAPLDEFERLLEAHGDAAKHQKAFEILMRWRNDPDLMEACRQRAADLLWRFAPNWYDTITGWPALPGPGSQPPQRQRENPSTTSPNTNAGRGPIGTSKR